MLEGGQGQYEFGTWDVVVELPIGGILTIVDQIRGESNDVL